MKLHPAERIFKISAGILLFSLSVLAVLAASNVVVFLITSLVIAYITSPAVNYAESAGLPRAVSAISVVLFLVGGLLLLSRTVLPVLGAQFVKLAQEINPQSVQQLANLLEIELRAYFTFLPEGFFRQNLIALYSSIFEGSALGLMMSKLFNLFTNLFYAVLVVPVTVFFLLRDGHSLERSLLKLVPNAYFETTLTLLSKIENSLGRYIKGVMLQSLIVATISSILLSFAGLKNALSVGVFLGVANVIPYFGPLMGDMLAVSVAIVEQGNMTMVGPVILALLITKAFDNVLLQPVIFSRSTELHPVMILFVVLIAAELGGVPGMIIAVPFATILRITLMQISWTFKNYSVFRPNVNAS